MEEWNCWRWLRVGFGIGASQCVDLIVTIHFEPPTKLASVVVGKEERTVLFQLMRRKSHRIDMEGTYMPE